MTGAKRCIECGGFPYYDEIPGMVFLECPEDCYMAIAFGKDLPEATEQWNKLFGEK